MTRYRIPPPGPPPPPGPGPPPGPCKPPYKGQQVYNLPCSIGAESVGWEGVGSGLISLKSAGSLCLGVDADQSAVLVECSSEYQWSYSGAASKLGPETASSTCLDINMLTGPMKAALWACNDRYMDGINEKFVSEPRARSLVCFPPSLSLLPCFSLSLSLSIRGFGSAHPRAHAACLSL